ncbi:MAG TPA: DUF4350 domain-containing protein [Terriglobales bacterium]|nr:DUF4350 domain-containing protein [Terriglobales bacterium]
MFSRGGRLGFLVLTLAGLMAGGYFLLFSGTALQTALPASSSLLTGPRGTSVLFGAYARAGLNVVHGFEPDSLPAMPPTQTVAFVLAPSGWANHLADQLYTFALRGGRVVLAAPPLPPPPIPGAAPDPEPRLDSKLGAHLIVEQASASNLPAAVGTFPLATPLVSLKLSPGWEPLVASGGRVYMARRRVGAGELILASEATFLSNEALAQSPDTQRLATLANGRSVVWVDESLHGLAPVRGVQWLLHRYHLEPGLVALLATLALLAWSVFGTLERPPDPNPDPEQPMELPDTAFTGYLRLLRRAIPPEQLTATYEKQTHAQRQPY